MKTYEIYLQEQGYTKGTITSYMRSQRFFQNWCDAKDLEPEFIDYKSCIAYVQHLQQHRQGKRISQKTVKHTVGALKIFFNCLIENQMRDDNPMQTINIRGVQRSLNHNLLEFEELEELYHTYPTQGIEFPNCPAVASRNKVITGFMVYQGMNSTSLKSLHVDHVNIDKGLVSIPGTRVTNGRTLQLQSQQIVPLLRYLEKDREILQEKISIFNQRLFPIRDDRFYIIPTLLKELRKINHKVKDTKQIRASVITHWLSSHNIREVQYMSGHRYISSTERYVQDNLESLQELIESLHPIG